MLQLKVSIKDKDRKGLPFPLKARLPIAIVLGFMADSWEVSTFMQKASNKTRSYYVNANGLRNFVIGFSLTKYLKNA